MSMNEDRYKKDIATIECLALFVSVVGILSALGVILCAALELV